MVWLVTVLAVTNLVTVGLLVLNLRERPPAPYTDAEVFEAPRPPGMRERDRRLITVEILNPIELARGRAGRASRMAGIAGSLAPGLTRRLVYDQTVKALRRELTAQAVHADVRVHVLRAVPRDAAVREQPPRVVELDVVDEVAPLDLSDP